MSCETVRISDFNLNPDNPRTITEKAFVELLKSLLLDPEILSKNKIKYDSTQDNMVLGGNQRLRAIQALDERPEWHEKVGTPKGYIPADWVIDCADLTPQQKLKLIILDNSPRGISGDWDEDAMANNPDWDVVPIADWGLAPDVDIQQEQKEKPKDTQPFYKIMIEVDTENEMTLLLEEFNSRGLKCQSLIY